MTEHLRWPAQIADGCATDAALAHATAVGLIETIDRYRFADPAHPIPAPGIADLPHEIHGHAIDALHAAANVHLLKREGDEAALDQALSRAQCASLAAQRGLRRLAQVGLGVAQHGECCDDVELLERTMVAVLVHDTTDATATEDAFPFAGRTSEEMFVEIAGLAARFYCEATVDSSGIVPLHIVFTADGDDVVHLRVDVLGNVTVDDRVYDAPIVITQVTADVVHHLMAVAASAVARGTVAWTRR